jgi:zona occludens toxin (predicted ATPase)
MALRLVTGVPGSGKSFYIVNHIVSKYCNKFGDTFILRKDYVIVTNISGLLLDVVDLDDAIKKAGTLEVFFSADVQAKVTKKYQDQGKKLIYIIDECQFYFHRRYYDRGVFAFFESHRHFGLDIYLISQNSNLVAKDLISLVEYEVRAVPRTIALGGRFNYLKKSNKDIIGREFIRKDKSIFNLYKSMQARETEKIRTPYLKFALPVILLLVFGFYGLSQSFVGRAVMSPVDHNSSDQSKKALLPHKKVLLPSENVYRNVVHEVFTPVSFIRYDSKQGSQVLIYNPINDHMYPLLSFPYPIKFSFTSNRLRLYAKLPKQNIEN